jgi:threonyl-tRNA synthetase
MLVVGDREMQSGQVSVRGRSKADLGSMPVPAVIELLRKDTAQAVLSH